MKSWHVVESEKQHPQAIMDLDAKFLDAIDFYDRPVLHLYEWETSCLTYGYFIKPEQFIHVNKLEEYGLKMARRPTGGGIVFHLTDFAFSLLIPHHYPHFSTNTLENYAFVNNWVKKALAPLLGDFQAALCEVKKDQELSLSFCMAKPTCFDLVIGQKKLGGAAQRKTKKGLLHQGTISLAFPEENILKNILLGGEELIPQMEKNSFVFLKDAWQEKELQELKQTVKQLLRNATLAIV